MKATKAAVKAQILIWLGVVASGFIRAVSVHSFVNPNNFAPGGVTGLATILTYLTGYNTGIWLFAFNLPLLIVAFFCIRKLFALKSALAIAVSSGFLLLFEKVKFFTYSDNVVLAALAGGILGGIGVSLMFKVGGSSAGTDIIATLIYRKFKSAGVSWFVFGLDAIVVLASFFVYDYQLTPVLLSFIEMFCSARMCDTILNGFRAATKFEIVTTHPEELAEEIFKSLERGVTAVQATGMYSKNEKTLLICLVRRRQIGQFQRIIRKYPDTFAYISPTSEVLGHGFSDSKSEDINNI